MVFLFRLLIQRNTPIPAAFAHIISLQLYRTQLA
jgi:hypothetical protein